MKRDTTNRADTRLGAPGDAWMDGLLRVPLFQKMLLANAALVFLTAAGSTAVAVEMLDAGLARSVVGGFLPIALAGAVVTLPVYAIILRFALAPLALLERTADRVESGDLSARAPSSPLADPRLRRLTRVFNRLLDHVIADRERLRELAARAVGAQEAERARIARELQEETAQTLSFLMLRLRVARRAESADRRDALLEGMREELAVLADRIQNTARALQPPALADLGVVAALESWIRTDARDGPPIHLRADDVRGLLTDDGELALYRVTQEAITNAIRHAAAASIEIEIRRSTGAVQLEVSDDGRGFAADAPVSPLGLGLFGMRERAFHVGGSVRIESMPGAGTRVLARFPVTVLDRAPARAPMRAGTPARIVRATRGVASLAIALLLVAAPTRAQTPAAPPLELPFALGEALEYYVKLGRFGAGRGTMRVGGPEPVRGLRAWTLAFDLNARVGPAVVEDRARSWIDPIRFASLRYVKHERTPLAAHQERIEIYPDLRLWADVSGARTATPSTAPLDELSFIYFLRTIDLRPGAEHSFDRHFDPDRNPVGVRILGRERVSVPAGDFDAVVVEMAVRDARRYGGRGVLRIHLTDDERRLPVRIESSIPVLGSAVLSLERWIPGGSPR